MTNKQNISKTINFEQVTMSVVPPQSSHRPLAIILDIINLWRVAYLYQPCLHHLKPKCLVLLRLVLCQGVVHVEPVELDLLQQQGTIDKDPKINMMTFLLVSTKGEMRVIRGGKWGMILMLLFIFIHCSTCAASRDQVSRNLFSEYPSQNNVERWENNFELNWLNIASDWSKQQLLQKNDITSDVTTQVIGEKTQVVEEYDAIMQWGNACPILLTTFEIVYSINQWRTDSMGSDIDRFIGLKIDFYTLVTCLVCVVIISWS